MRDSLAVEIIKKYVRCMRLFGSSIKKYIISAVCTIIINLLELLEAVFFAEIVQSLYSRCIEKFTVAILLAFLMGLISIFLSLLSAKLDTDIRVKILIDLKSKVTKLFFTRDIVKEDFSSGEINSIIQDDTEAIITYAYKVISYLSNFFIILSVFIVLVKISVGWSFLFFLLFVIVGKIQKNGAYGIRKRAEICLSKENAYQKSLNEELNGLHAIRYQNVENDILKFNKKKLIYIGDAHVQQRKYILKVSSSSKLIMYIGKIVLFILMGSSVFSGRISVKDFLIFYSYMSIFTSNYMSIVTMLTSLQPLLVNVNRLCKIIDAYESNYTYEYKGKCQLIEYKNIQKKYGERNIFSDVNVKIDFKNTYAIIGKNGVGKTTFLKLLLGEEEPCSGEIRINNLELDSKEMSKHRKNICYYAPSPFIIHGMTIRDNILLGIENKEGKDELVNRLCKDFLLWEDIIKCEKGLDAVIGEDVILSSGQEKKIELIRAFLNESGVILLDEPMVSLDNEIRNCFSRLFEVYMAERSILVVEHELDEVSYTDIVMEIIDGKIVPKKGNIDKECIVF